MSKKSVAIVLFSVLLSAFSAGAVSQTPPPEYTKWLKELKQEMADKGISEKTLETAFAKNYYHPRHDVVKKDRRQTEFVLTSSAYLHRVVSAVRVQKGREHYQELKKKYPQGLSGVPLHYLLAFWGIETNYGTHKGGYPAIEALTILSYDKRRSAFFRNELYHALKILDEGHISFNKMESSWAGAMGHFQFMPSTFASYAIDADNDGHINIWSDFDDAIASAANYLSEIGWKTEQPWGMPVKLAWNFNYALADRHKNKTVAEWKERGVEIKGAQDDWQGAVIIPEGRRGQAYMVFDNFHTIMDWNKSENYALAVGLLADKLKNNKLSANIKVSKGYPLTRDDIKKVQKFIQEQKIANISIDGTLGTQTRRAIKKLQKKFKLPADGYPDYLLLKNIQNFAQRGYYPPIPSRKLHRAK